LPVIEVPAAGKAPGDALAIFVSGDGGLGRLRQAVAGRLAQGGLPVVGVDSLRYFWTARTRRVCQRLVRIADYYASIGTASAWCWSVSQGADVLPAAYNHLQATRQDVPLLALMSFGEKASYEFHVSNWLGKVDDGLPIAPEVAKIPQAKALYFCSAKDGDALCPKLPTAVKAACVQLPGDHRGGRLLRAGAAHSCPADNAGRLSPACRGRAGAHSCRRGSTEIRRVTSISAVGRCMPPGAAVAGTPHRQELRLELAQPGEAVETFAVAHHDAGEAVPAPAPDGAGPGPTTAPCRVKA
jgi:hypothetical protein